MGLTETEDIKKRWQECTEELYTNDLQEPDNQDGVITHLEPDILECEVKWALGSITVNKASGGDGIPDELFQILKNDVVKVLLLNMSVNLENPAVATGLKSLVFIPIPKKGSANKGSSYHKIALFSHASKVILKIFQVRFQQYMNWELSNGQAGFRKCRGIRDQIVNICWIIQKQEFQENIYCFIDHDKAFDCMDHNKLWKILRDGNTRPPDLPPEKPIYRSRSNS